MTRLWGALILLFCAMTPVIAQVQQSGTVTYPDGAYWVTQGVIGDAGNSGSGNLGSLGITNNGGNGICIQDTKVHTGPYRTLCEGVGSAGAFLNLTPYNGAANIPFNITVNGTTYPFPFSIGGIVGPSTTVSGDLSCWNNLVGTLLSDCGLAPSQLTVTVSNIAAMVALGSASADTPSVQVTGYHSAGDGGGGVFNWASASTATADSCTVFAATGVTTGRWIRQITGPQFSVDWCGTYHNGTTANIAASTANDDTTAIQAALNYLGSASGAGPGGTLLFSSNPYYLHTGPLIVYAHTKLLGMCPYQGNWPEGDSALAGTQCTILRDDTSNDTIQDGSVNTEISGILFESGLPIFQANINTSGNVSAIHTDYRGFGLSSCTIAISYGYGTGATATASVSGGTISGTPTVTSGGTGYYNSNAGTQAVPATLPTCSGVSSGGAFIRLINGVSQTHITNSAFVGKTYAINVRNTDNSAVYWNNLLIDHNTMWGQIAQPISLWSGGSQTTEVSDNFIELSQSYPIYIPDAISDLKIEHNNIQGMYIPGTLGVYFQALDTTPSNGVVITNNDIGNITGSSNGSAGGVGLFLQYLNGAIVSGNSFYGPLPICVDLNASVNSSHIGPNSCGPTTGSTGFTSGSSVVGNIFEFPADLSTLVSGTTKYSIGNTENWIWGPNGFQPPATNVTTTYAVSTYDQYIHADATGGAFTVTLPSYSGAGVAPSGTPYTIDKTDSSGNAVTINGGGHNIIGASTYALSAQYNSVSLSYDPVNTVWTVVGSH